MSNRREDTYGDAATTALFESCSGHARDKTKTALYWQHAAESSRLPRKETLWKREVESVGSDAEPAPEAASECSPSLRGLREKQHLLHGTLSDPRSGCDLNGLTRVARSDKPRLDLDDAPMPESALRQLGSTLALLDARIFTR